MKHTDPNTKNRSAAGSVAVLRRRWHVVSIAVISLWAIWALLDAFVIPRDIVAVEEAGAAPEAVWTGSGLNDDEAPLLDTEAVLGIIEDDDTGAGPGIIQDDGSETGSGILPDEGGETVSVQEYEEPESDMGEAPRDALDEPVITDYSYDDGYITIEISTMRMLDTDIYIAEVEIIDPSCIRTALAGGAFGRNLTETTSKIAERNDAIFAVNGDYYGFRDTGYVMRNGYLYRSVPAKDPDQEDLVLYEDGSIDILREADVSAEKIKASGASDIFSFGPGLVEDGEITVDENDEVERAQVTNPRTAIGLLSPLHYLFVVSDGRTDESIGLSLYELAGLMKDLGCVTAYNLDGGGSSTMWFNGRVLNHPTTFGDKITERSVSDIVYIAK